ncbi:hypothetical protein ACFYZ8_33475 [Streptomyces sp. NPDC001668]|uniref:hypothetical protein n=1 Tax=Streptomyces sp. NPDC001668 TaxID=3364598 RepID=UPI003683D956
MDDVQISVWHYFSFDHALTACTLSRHCGRLEAEYRAGSGEGTSPAEHMAYATGSVIASFCFLEASINEFYATAGRDNLEVAGGRGGLEAGDRELIAEIAEDVERLPTLTLFQLALTVLRRPPLDPGTQVYADADLLRRLRNALVHYTPRLRPADGAESGGADDTTRLVTQLRQRGFEPNVFYADSGNPYFPQKCLGHGCTTWAWKTALALADAFHTRLGITPVYEDARAAGRLEP